ncbi:hypothetical protein PIB30_040028 [Stylosanthes scabra]|uniref:Uncharacterized protein n=1 Tax=Stylosanthes scabra TaxID=79078 RepID=A0ABU6REK5_9FABA|nr:hypothetical protein [Stylosanthes scabra]
MEEAKVRMQIWGLAEQCKTPKLGEKIAACMGEVLECEVFESSRTQEIFLKATVNMKISTPFKKGLHLGNKHDDLTWVDFRYEMLPTCCYYSEHGGKKIVKEKAQIKNQKGCSKEQEKKMKEKLTERLMNKLANLSMTNPKRSDIGKGTSQTPALVVLDSIQQNGTLRNGDKKGIKIQEPTVELDT